MANREKAEVSMPAEKKMPKSKVTPAVRSLGAEGEPVISRAYIIENKPKNKVVREYFETIVEKVIDFADNEED
jgi:hypothetical protein